MQNLIQFIWRMVTQRQMAADPHNKPADLGCHLYVCLWAAAI